MSDQIFSRIVGIVGKPHGSAGYVFIRVVSDYPETIQKGHFLYLDEECKEKVVIKDIKEITSRGRKRTLFKFSSFNSREDALALRNKNLYRNSKNTPPLDSGSYWIEDLIGCAVYLPEKEKIGEVFDVEKYAFNDNLMILDDNKNIIIVPMLEDFIKAIDIKSKKIILNMLPEYI